MADDRKTALDYLKANHVTSRLPSTRRRLRGERCQYKALPDLGADPMTYIIGRDGKILDASFGYDSRRTQAALRSWVCKSGPLFSNPAPDRPPRAPAEPPGVSQYTSDRGWGT